MENKNPREQLKRFLIAIIVGAMTVIIALLTSINLEFSLVENLVMSWILTTIYALFAFFLIEPTVKINPIRYIEKPVVQEVIKIIEKPIVKEIQIPIENKVIEVVEKPVIKEVIKYVERPVKPIRIVRIIKQKSRKLNIPKFKFIASTQTRTYHKRTCKFTKMLKKKFKLHSNLEAIFKKRHFKACKSCIKKLRPQQIRAHKNINKMRTIAKEKNKKLKIKNK
jgi:hypothetical protein